MRVLPSPMSTRGVDAASPAIVSCAEHGKRGIDPQIHSSDRSGVGMGQGSGAVPPGISAALNQSPSDVAKRSPPLHLAVLWLLPRKLHDESPFAICYGRLADVGRPIRSNFAVPVIFRVQSTYWQEYFKGGAAPVRPGRRAKANGPVVFHYQISGDPQPQP